MNRGFGILAAREAGPSETFCLSGRLLGYILVFWEAPGRHFGCPWRHFACLGSCWESFWMHIVWHTAHSTQDTPRTEQRVESTEHKALSTKHRAHSKEHIAKSTEHTAKHTAPIREQCTIETALLEQNHPLTGFVGPSCLTNFLKKSFPECVQKASRRVPGASQNAPRTLPDQLAEQLRQPSA